MTPSPSFARLDTPARRAKPTASRPVLPPITIHRDIAFADAPFTRPELFAADDSGQAAPLLQIGLAAVTLPTIAYSLSQLWNLVSGDTLLHAVRAIVP